MNNAPVCPLCGSQDSEERFSQRGYKLFGCDGCELLFIDPYPASSDEVHRHVSDYSYEDLEITDPESHYRSSVEFYKRYFPLVAKECEDATSVLDIGCGTGHLLERLGVNSHLSRVGIELNSGRAEMARKTAGCPVHEVPVEKFSSAKKFDVILMINVTSHIPVFAFDSLFESLRSLLSDNGKLILKVGEVTKQVKRWDMLDWAVPDHIHFFGLNTVEFICSKYGFRICKHERIPYSEDLFSPEWWRAPGRSALRNMVKSVVVRVPLALRVLARYYDLTHGRRVYSSFIVLSPQAR